jgi:hypothetical protein
MNPTTASRAEEHMDIAAAAAGPSKCAIHVALAHSALACRQKLAQNPAQHIMMAIPGKPGSVIAVLVLLTCGFAPPAPPPAPPAGP